MYLIAINSCIYFIFGIVEILNFELGFEKYDSILLLALVLGFSTTGTILLYFFENEDLLFINVVFLFLSLALYKLVQVFDVVALWFVALWLFSFMHYSFWIMGLTTIQKESHPHYKGRLFTYYYSITSANYCFGSLTAAFGQDAYWIIVLICLPCVILLTFKYKKIASLPAAPYLELDAAAAAV
jgi:hypothetical protein